MSVITHIICHLSYHCMQKSRDTGRKCRLKPRHLGCASLLWQRYIFYSHACEARLISRITALAVTQLIRQRHNYNTLTNKGISSYVIKPMANQERSHLMPIPFTHQGFSSRFPNCTSKTRSTVQCRLCASTIADI